VCGRYTIAKSRQVLSALLRREISEDVSLPVYNASPGQALPVVLGREPGRVVPLAWGVHVASGRMAGRLLINARSETAHVKPMFRDAFRHRRCLVIADGFYEWQAGPDGKQPYRITRTDEGVFAFAGIWMEIDPSPAFVILTTEPNHVTRPIHDRMPVMLEDAEQAPWLDPDASVAALIGLLDPYPENEMVAYPVSRAVNNSRNEGTGLIQPVQSESKQRNLEW
jgi:putative SOS response-associated peptidase YedK